MNQVLLVALAWVLPLFSFGAIAWGARRWFHRSDRRNPLTRDLLRSPGHSLRQRREDLSFDLLTYVSVGSAMPLLMFAMYLAQAPHSDASFSAWLALVIAAAALMVCAVQVVRAIGRLRNISLGLDAEAAVGQELNCLMLDGFRVFHDVRGEGPFNVDHVVVGPQGVFAVETKGRAKPVRTEGGDAHRVEYDGSKLRFPGWTESVPLEQARRNAEWLAKWLSSAVGSEVPVRPVLMLPGWYIERTKPPGIAVLNGVNCRAFFTKARGSAMSEQLVAQVVHQLDARCRDIAPVAYRPVPAK